VNLIYMASAEGKVTVPVKPVPWKEGDRDVPAVLGHDEGQPAYGVAVKTWRNGPKLMADIVNVPASVAAAVKAGQYFQTSAEVYDDTGEAGLPAGGGCMLRRIALLGADIPQVKTLSDLPKPDGSGNLKGVEIFAAGTHRGINYTEGDLDKMVANFNRYSAPAVKFAAGQLRHKIAVTFIKKHSEVPMDRQRIIDALVAAGMDVGVASNLDDATLQALQPVADKVAPGSQPPDKMADADVEPNATQDSGAVIPPTVPSDEAATDSPEFDRTAIVAQLVGAGLDANELNALSDDDLKKRLEQINAIDKNADMAGSDETIPDDPATAPGPQADGSEVPVQKLSCGAKKMSSKKYAEQQVTAMHAQLIAAQDQINKTVAQAAKDVKKAKFEAFKEVLRTQGRLVPAMEENGLLDQFVDHLDHSTVRKFGEGKKTQFEMFQDILGMVPRVVKFGESVKSSTNGVLKLSESKAADEGEEGVRTRYRQFSEKYQKMGFKEDEAVEAFKRRKAKDPLLTAADVLPA
jgi:hypothetical protein